MAGGMIGLGQQRKAEAKQGFGAVSQLESGRNLASKNMEAVKAAQKSTSVGTGAGMGFAAGMGSAAMGAQYGMMAGPMGALVGAGVGWLASELF